MTIRVLSIAIVLLGLGLPIDQALSGSASDFQSIMKPTLHIHFNNGNTFDSPNKLTYERQGGRIFDRGISGKALSLGKNEYLSFDAKDVISPEEGTIIFWVRPHWSDDDKYSHTFVSFSWDDRRKSYFSISKGWWEKDGGMPYTYFIFNNAESAKTEKVVSYTKGMWMHMACTWRAGEEGFVRLYVNGLFVAEGHKKPRQTPMASGKLYIGADLGTPMSAERWGDFDVDELAVFKRSLQDEDILQIYNVQNPRKYSPLRNARGQILQTRAIFDEGRGWMTKAGADETIRRIKKAGFNVYIPCVWHGQGTRYPSALAPPEVNATFSEGDPLKYLIEIAHKNGIEVHPWFTVTLRQREFLQQYYEPGTPKGAFDIHKPEFKIFIVDLMLDVVERYNVDGINLDFIRTMGLCTSDYCREQYRRLYNRDLIDDLSSRRSDGRLAAQLQSWIDSAVEDVVRNVSIQGKRIKKNLIISVDGHPIPKHLPPSPQGRSEVEWAKKGLIDVIFSMDYQRAPDYDRHALIREELGTAAAYLIIIANYEGHPKKGIKPRRGKHLAELMKHNLSIIPHGMGVYIYSQLTEEQIDALAASFNDRAIPRLKKAGVEHMNGQVSMQEVTR